MTALLSIPLFLLFFTGCTEKTKNYENTKDMVSDVKTKINCISVEAFKKIFDEKKGHIQLIDCREQEEFLTGCIPGAINIPRGLLEFQIGDKVPRTADVFIYCDDGNRSTLAANMLYKIKYSKVTFIDGGLNAWTQAYPKDIDVKPSLGTGTSVEAPKKAGGGGCGG